MAINELSQEEIASVAGGALLDVGNLLDGLGLGGGTQGVGGLLGLGGLLGAVNTLVINLLQGLLGSLLVRII